MDEVNSDIQEIKEKKSVSNDDLYRRSTQYRLWSFLPNDLLDRQVLANEKGRESAKSSFDKVYKELQLQNEELFAKNETELLGLLDLIAVQEEISFIQYYSNMIVKLSAIFQMPTQVKATAISFFKKFYLVHSVMEYHPKNILYTCLFLAAKSENFFISIDLFVKPLKKVENDDILSLEFTVLQSLNFTLLVHHPYRPLYGFFLDFQSVLLFPALLFDVNIDAIGKLYDRSKSWLNDYALLSNVAFLFTPPQIALSALYDCDKRITDKYLKTKYSKNRANYEQLLKTILNCIDAAKNSKEPSKDESTKIDRKCYFCLNPKKLLEKRVNKLKTANVNENNDTKLNEVINDNTAMAVDQN